MIGVGDIVALCGIFPITFFLRRFSSIRIPDWKFILYRTSLCFHNVLSGAIYAQRCPTKIRIFTPHLSWVGAGHPLLYGPLPIQEYFPMIFSSRSLSVWYYVRVTFCPCGILSMWHYVRGIMSRWYYVQVECCPCDIFSVWHFVRVAFCPCGILSV